MAVTNAPGSTQTAPPAGGTWALDTTHTDVSFTARHLMVTKVRGRFAVPAAPSRSPRTRLSRRSRPFIDVPSVNSGEAGRDEHLRTADFFDAEHYPTITFRSTKVEDAGDGEYKVTGDLTIKDVTRPVTLDLEYLGTVASPWGDQRAGFSATTEISRKEWGIEYNMALEAGGVVVGDKIKLNIDAEDHPPEVAGLRK